MISLIHPSRGRAKKSYSNSMDWIRHAGCEVELIVRIDTSDPTAGEYYKEYGGSVFPYGRIAMDDNKSVVEAANTGARASTGDILIYLSDDFKCPYHWGQMILKEFEGIDTPMMLKVDDCLQKFDVGVLTIPIMNRILYKTLGYFFHPFYKSMHVDVDLFETCKRHNFIKYCPHLKFPHEHHSIGKAENDETYKRSERNWNQGLEVIKKRRREGFPV